jgi:two-component system, NtrC family, response regulator GlrR
MDPEKIRVCMISISDSPSALENLKRVVSSCIDPPLILSTVFPAVSDRQKVQETLEAIDRLKPKLIFIVLSSGHFEQAEFFVNSLQEEGLKPDILAFLEDPTSEIMIDLLKLGITDVISPPYTPENVVPRIWRILNSSRDPDEKLLGSLKEKLGLRKLIGRNSAFLAEVNKIPQIARCDANVLIAGETGTGKEIYARSIHYLSRRAAKPFIAVSCGAIPTDLFENELYGHERGAFTAAMTPQAGLILEAEGGSLFLDDVDCIPLGAQTKVLRFLQEKEFRPLGSARTQRSDTRIIASTNTDLAKAVSQNIFRRDLYYRLSVISIALPPLRRRQEDLPLLARHFIEKYQDEFDSPVKDISPAALEMFMGYDWPGNVRELENVIERAVAFSSKALLDVKDICLPEEEACLGAKTFREAKSQAVTQFEKQYIQELLSTHQGNISQSARAARKDRRAFYELIRKHKIDARNYKPASG